MPITIRTHPIEGEAWRSPISNDAEAMLSSAASTEASNVKRFMDSSFSKSTPAVTPSTNGLVSAAVEAWNNHHHLVLRPDDIWIAVISQLGFFVDAHAEELRSFFVAHQGQRELTVRQDANPDNADYGRFATDMADELSKNVNDPELVPWIIPNFSTTTDTDRVAASVLLMGAMKKYFSYNFCCDGCGIPSVTLLGTRGDWVDLQARIDKIPNLGGEAVEFHRLLNPIARHMVLSFDEPQSTAVLEFWRLIASWEPPSYMGSGPPIVAQISGWITAFCFWDAEGHRNQLGGAYGEYQSRYLDGVEYKALPDDQKVAGWAAVPVKVTYEVAGVVIEERKCRMVAGSIGMRPGRHAEMSVRLDGPAPPPAERETPGRTRVTVYPGLPPQTNPDFDTVQPHTGWWIYEVKEKPENKRLQKYRDLGIKEEDLTHMFGWEMEEVQSVH
ncbi:hypothetical protein B0T25DRAFT_546431 [Lasiosphaeria hispida]|uniref:DUF4419 domain-containing protein n=1 Tax=Lasiosphaeria hispida TaxID=260671 RepID=A0AAJ0HD98_9PEZI|nr:hypothetical protein B0T25DRAFT_546431 [Lasiosphaeria hispida]